MKHDHSEALERIAAESGRAPLDVLETFLERAAIREYEGMYTRTEAERLAVDDVVDMLQRTARPVDATGQHPQGTGTGNQVASDEVRHAGSQHPRLCTRGAQ